MAHLGFNRSRVLAWCMIVIGALFIARLFYLQVVAHGYYDAEALKEHTSKFTLPAKRGLIYARDGVSSVVPLVLNEPMYTIYADPRYVKDISKTADALRQIAGGTLVGDIEKSLADKNLQYVVLARQLNDDQANLLKKQSLPGVGLQAQNKRVYPEGSLGAQLLGYVNSEGQGQYGIEQALNGELSGKPGMLKAVTDVNGIPISTDKNDVQIPAQDGKNLVLTVDRNIQAYAEQALKAGLDAAKAEHGSAVVIDPRTGAVLAMATLPTYDPSKYYEVKDYGTFANPVVSAPFEAGSVIKSLTMATGLNEGVIKPDSTYENTGSVQVDDATIKNVLQVSGTRTMTEVLQYSLNTGAVHVLQELSGGGNNINQSGRDKLYDYFTNRYMLGKKTGIEQSGESSGIVISPSDEQGNNVRYANMTFGQGMDNTMLQIAAAFSSVTNGGTYYQPHLVSGYMNDDGNVTNVQPHIVKSDVITESASNDLRGMLHTARAETFPGLDKAGYMVGGKTGTAQIIDPKTGKYEHSNAIGTYVGFGGNSTSEYVIMVRVVDAKIGGYAGSMAAAPIFADISNWLIDYLKIQPIR
jgi:cell division protein FtsI/penicillin-binding protein 2